MDRYSVINYFDVWNDGEGGWEVNNQCHEIDIEVKDYTDHTEIIQILVDHELLRVDVTEEDFDIWNDFEMIEFRVEKTGMPVFRLELIRD